MRVNWEFLKLAYDVDLDLHVVSPGTNASARQMMMLFTLFSMAKVDRRLNTSPDVARSLSLSLWKLCRHLPASLNATKEAHDEVKESDKDPEAVPEENRSKGTNGNNAVNDRTADQPSRKIKESANSKTTTDGPLKGVSTC